MGAGRYNARMAFAVSAAVPQMGDGAGHLRRFDLESFSALMARHGGQVVYSAGDRNALAELPPAADAGG